jgi:hypothetical protein
MLTMLSVFLREVKREPGGNPGLPRSGKQERTPRIRAGFDREAVAIREAQFAYACKSEDLPWPALTTPNCDKPRGKGWLRTPLTLLGGKGAEWLLKKHPNPPIKPRN